MSLGLLKNFFFILILCNSVFANPIEGNITILKLLDKTTNKLSQKKLEVKSNTIWDSLNIKIYACYSSPPEEIPEDYVLIEVKDTLIEEKEYIYRGWMISSSPDVTPLEHPIYDLWLIDCIVNKTS